MNTGSRTLETLELAQDSSAMPLLTEKRAAEAIWEYYKAHKADLVLNVSEHREVIMAKTMSGVPVPEAFLPFIAPVVPPPAPPKRKRLSR